MARLVMIVLLCMAGLITRPAAAHENLPIVLNIEQIDNARFLVGVRAPGNLDAADIPQPRLVDCTPSPSSALARIWLCPPGERPAAVTLDWPGDKPPSGLLLRARFADGQKLDKAYEAGSTMLALPSRETAASVLGDYVVIGVEHILFGLDHLLFLVCLVLIAGTFSRVALTVTGFTLGHAVTISLASLDLVHASVPAVEAVIALSIVFVAAELLRERQDSLTFRHPVIVAAGFGLLHGLGFAAALREIGLAQTKTALSLIGFNLGVEAGQILFIITVFAIVALARRLDLKPVTSQHARTAIVAAVGCLAGYWFIERTITPLS